MPSTPEQCGQRILRVCRNNYLHVGEQLLPHLLVFALLDTKEFQEDEIIEGLHWLVNNGYLEQRGPLQSGYTLTAKGVSHYNLYVVVPEKVRERALGEDVQRSGAGVS